MHTGMHFGVENTKRRQYPSARKPSRRTYASHATMNLNEPANSGLQCVACQMLWEDQ